MKTSMLTFILCTLFCLWGTAASALPLDLSAFTASPDNPAIVVISNDDISLYENSIYQIVQAKNLSYWVTDDAGTLSFDYLFTGGPGDVDYLELHVNSITVVEIDRFGTGSQSFDMAPFRGQEIALSFGLEFDSNFDNAFTSQATISNIQLSTIPEPSTLILLGSGLLAFLGVRRTRS